MSHTKYTTRAFVLKTKNSGEADKTAFLFSEDFGLLRVFAKSVRKDGAKLKPYCQTGIFLNATVIRGKELWRFIEAECENFPPLSFPKRKLKEKIFGLAFSLSGEEERNHGVFSTIDFFVQRILHEQEENLEALEIVTILRLLEALGYGKSPESFSISMEGEVNNVDIEISKKYKKELIALINEALESTHLIVNKKDSLI